MSEHSLSSGWLSSWASNLSPLLSDLLAGFEAKHGFPPGPNEIRSASEDDADAVRTLSDTGLPHADLLTFYQHIGEVDLADVGNGYWVHSAETVLDHLREYGPVGVEDGRDPSGLVIASDGGGLLFVMEPDGAVFRTRTATLDEPEFDRTADSLRQFLELLAQSVARFIDTGEPGYL